MSTEKLAEDINTQRYVGVEFDGSDPPKVQTPSTKGERPIGILEETGEQDEIRRVHRVWESDPKSKIKLASSVSQGDHLAVDTNGKGYTAGIQDEAFAVALTDGDSDEVIEIAMFMESVEPVMDISVGSESSNTITVTYQFHPDAQEKAIVGLYEDQGGDTGLSLVSDATGSGQDITAGTNGTVVTTDGGKQAIFQTDSSGALDIDVNDNSGSLSGDRWLKIEPFEGDRAYWVKVTFS